MMFSSFGIMKNAANTLISQHNSMYISIQHLIQVTGIAWVCPRKEMLSHLATLLLRNCLYRMSHPDLHVL